jgi:hypothetical protein
MIFGFAHIIEMSNARYFTAPRQTGGIASHGLQPWNHREAGTAPDDKKF